MSSVKLHINMSQGIIDAEGDQDFVWRVYEDFRDRLNGRAVSAAPLGAAEIVEQEYPETPGIKEDEEKPKRRAKRRTASGSPSAKEKSAPTVKGYRPRLLHDLDTTGIKEFLGQYHLTNHTDSIVAMSKFLASKGVSPASFDAFFTCYSDADLKVPEAFGQAFIRARGGKGFITFTTPDDVELTLRGRNHIDHGGIKKASA